MEIARDINLSNRDCNRIINKIKNNRDSKVFYACKQTKSRRKKKTLKKSSHPLQDPQLVSGPEQKNTIGLNSKI